MRFATLLPPGKRHPQPRAIEESMDIRKVFDDLRGPV